MRLTIRSIVYMFEQEIKRVLYSSRMEEWRTMIEFIEANEKKLAYGNLNHKAEMLTKEKACIDQKLDLVINALNNMETDSA